VKPCPGHAGYFVTEVGEVYSCWRRGKHYRLGPIYTPQLLRCTIVNGYIYASLGPGVHQYVHVLVLEAFVGPRAGPETRHLNGDPSDNCVGNLCWGSVSANQLDRREHGTSNAGERNGSSKLTEPDVRSIRLLSSGGAKVPDIARRLGHPIETVRDIVKHKTWAHLEF
jgi:hypothetical protein